MSQPTNPLETVVGQRRVTITTTDGKSLEASVYALPISRMNELYAAQADEAELLRLYLGADPITVDSLSHESAEAILEAGDALNADFFDRWLRRRLARLERLGVSIADLLKTAATLQPSPDGSPKPQSSPA